MIELLVVIFVILFFWPTKKSTKESNKNQTAISMTGIRPCPPHKWQEHAIQDQFGEKLWTHRCDKCKKLVSQIE